MILADEMGLGKTCQAITFLDKLFSAGRKFLILAPLSVQYHWKQEFVNSLMHLDRLAVDLTDTEGRQGMTGAYDAADFDTEDFRILGYYRD
ncbi:unnamed protein product [Soboliphyme baturini]|uniref:SNF2_N domain-containing protein n=1 Tax=Soboliphyme baturini TaxID=241478 RepID=A0A183IXI9_9BILA|nr:unnamed protein product [Soboliphyme baturini]